MFYGLGTEHFFSREFRGFEIEPGAQYNYLFGVGFAVSQDDAVTAPNARSAHQMVSDAHRAKAELLAERRTESTWWDQYQSYYQFLVERAQSAGN